MGSHNREVNLPHSRNKAGSLPVLLSVCRGWGKPLAVSSAVESTL